MKSSLAMFHPFSLPPIMIFSSSCESWQALSATPTERSAFLNAVRLEKFRIQCVKCSASVSQPVGTRSPMGTFGAPFVFKAACLPWICSKLAFLFRSLLNLFGSWFRPGSENDTPFWELWSRAQQSPSWCFAFVGSVAKYFQRDSWLQCLGWDSHAVDLNLSVCIPMVGRKPTMKFKVSHGIEHMVSSVEYNMARKHLQMVQSSLKLGNGENDPMCHSVKLDHTISKTTCCLIQKGELGKSK